MSVDGIQRINKTSWKLKVFKYLLWFLFNTTDKSKRTAAKFTQDDLFQITCNIFCYTFSKHLQN